MTTTTTRSMARGWLLRIVEKTGATPPELARMLCIGEGEVAKLLDASEAEALAPQTDEAAARLLLRGGKLTTAASFEWTPTAQP